MRWSEGGQVITPFSSMQSWLSARRGCGIGASDAAAVLGVSPWKSAAALWAELSGLLPPSEGEARILQMGKDLEPITAKYYALDSGRCVDLSPLAIHTHDDFPEMFATPDAFQGPDLAELKASGSHSAAQWANEPPLYYQVQLQQQMACTGRQRGTIVLLLWGAARVRWWDFERNDTFLAMLRDRVGKFIESVRTRTRPEWDGSESTRDALKAMHPTAVAGKFIRLGDWSVEADERIARLDTEIKSLELEQGGLKNKIIAEIGDATDGLLPNGDGRWQYATVAPKRKRPYRKLVRIGR